MVAAYVPDLIFLIYNIIMSLEVIYLIVGLVIGFIVGAMVAWLFVSRRGSRKRQEDSRGKKRSKKGAEREVEKPSRKAASALVTLTTKGDAILVNMEKMGDSIEPIELVRVPAGEFIMGSDPDQDLDAAEWEQPQHRLHIPGYFISKYPITNAQYAAYIKTSGASPPSYWEGGGDFAIVYESALWQGGQLSPVIEDHPVVCISWVDAMTFCSWLSRKIKKLVRLPAESEWEKAARGTDGRIYPWGNKWDSRRLNCSENTFGETTPVGKFSPTGDSPYGCSDMAGNVWEWTLSITGEYPYQRADGREDLNNQEAPRVLRGGAFNFRQRYMRCTARAWYTPDTRDIYGFRIVMPLSSSSG